MNKKKVLLGMSGGVDSSVAAFLLKEQGYEVFGITLLLTETDDGSAAKDAKAVCDRLGIEHITRDLKTEFKNDVTDAFTKAYKNGKTPNPCVVCNKLIKFGEMLKIADELGVEKLATGHYAKIAEEDGKFYLKKAAFLEKDQTYFLYTLSQETLSRVILPLGEYTKDEVRKIAEENGFSTAHKKDSQDICFIPDGDKNKYLIRFLPEQKGDFLDESGKKIGTHTGAHKFTIGQRKGLGMGFGKPMFVLATDTIGNTVTLGENDALLKNTFSIADVSFSAFDAIPDSLSCSVKVRYSSKEIPCTLTKTDSGYLVMLTSPARAITPGQAAVFYSGDTLLGGGTIL